MKTPTSLSSIPRSHAINEPQKQSNIFFTFIRKLVSDLKSTCWPTQNHQPVADPTEIIYEKESKSFSDSISTATNDVVSSNQHLTERADSKSNVTRKENDTHKPVIHTKNNGTNAESEINLNDYNGYDIIQPENIDMTAQWFDEYNHMKKENKFKPEDSEVSIDSFSDAYVTTSEDTQGVDEYFSPHQDIVDEKNQSNFYRQCRRFTV